MDYYKSYTNATTIVDRIREAASRGATASPKSGLVARMEDTEVSLRDFDEIRAQYMRDVQDTFNKSREANSAEIENYLGKGLGTASMEPPERNPANWEDAPLMGPVSAEVTDTTVRKILETIKTKESGGDYSIKTAAKGQSASGGYQITNGTWKGLTNKYGIGTEYKTAKSAPPEVQDAVAARYVTDILEENNNDITKVPLVWYTGNAQGEISAEALAINNGLTPAKYQYDWMRTFNKVSGEQE